MKTAIPDAPAGYLDLGASRAEAGGPAAIYVHFPFCRHMCTYCDFDTFTGIEGFIDSYADAIVSQTLASPRVRGTSLYVGGGTPSMMSVSQATRLLRACNERFGLPPDAEVTIEANPTDMTPERLEGYRRAGYNRLSVGVQSADAGLLRILGRRHSAEEAEAAIGAAHAAGFDNVSVDLIYGVPRQDLSMWRSTIETVVQWGVSHLSCYMLTVEPGTPMERAVERGTLVVPSDEETVEMYELAIALLGRSGFHRYEISNWAKPGRESSHNLTYWRNQGYLAIGAGAAGYWNGIRYKLAPGVGGFIKGVRSGQVPLSEHEEIDRHREMSESLILGLRLVEGVSVAGFRDRFGAAPEDEFAEPLDWAEGAGLLERGGDALRLTGRGVLLSNELFQRLL